jgi:hypothetical protein
MTDQTDISKHYNGRFQLTVDTDSVLISQAPDKDLSRIILANLQEEQLRQIVTSLHHAGVAERAIDLLAEQAYVEPKDQTVFTLYLGLDKKLDEKLNLEISSIVSDYSESFTLTQAFGHFKGEQEHTIMVQLGADHSGIAYQCAEALRSHFKQDGVGVVAQESYKRVVAN